VTPYTLRHTCASLLSQRGVPVNAAAVLLGHDPSMYLRTYAHLYPDDLAAAARVLDDVGADRRAGLSRGWAPRIVAERATKRL